MLLQGLLDILLYADASLPRCLPGIRADVLAQDERDYILAAWPAISENKDDDKCSRETYRWGHPADPT